MVLACGRRLRCRGPGRGGLCAGEGDHAAAQIEAPAEQREAAAPEVQAAGRARLLRACPRRAAAPATPSRARGRARTPGPGMATVRSRPSASSDRACRSPAVWRASTPPADLLDRQDRNARAEPLGDRDVGAVDGDLALELGRGDGALEREPAAHRRGRVVARHQPGALEPAGARPADSRAAGSRPIVPCAVQPAGAAVGRA